MSDSTVYINGVCANMRLVTTDESASRTYIRRAYGNVEVASVHIHNGSTILYWYSGPPRRTTKADTPCAIRVGR